ncbi:MAG: DUF1552 domain-containing protein [Myxococcota bacterium]|jgi:Protein of unknown function (DUF1552)|nr:DUF1552 domain-containing protein [Myxococcota bacterium]
MSESRAGLSRRLLLRGFGGAMLGLPFLEALAPRRARAQAEPAQTRFGVFFCCNGVEMNRWFPKGDFGALTDAHLAGTANEPLTPFRSKLLFPRGVHMTPRGFDRDGGGGDDHGKGMAHKLTAQFADGEDWLAQGPSIDHVLAAAINPGSEGSRRAPLNLMVGRSSRSRGVDYISYSGAGRAVAGIVNPWNAYAEFVNLNGGGAEADEAMRRISERRQSVLDLVNEQFADLKRGPLSADDQRKLDAHLTAIREIELGLGGSGLSCLDSTLRDAAQKFEGRGKEVEQEANYPVIADLQVDIYAVALACGFTRVATLQFDRGAGGPTFRWDGMEHEYNHHKLSHGKVRDDCFGDSTENGCENVDGYEDMLFDIDHWHQQRLARLLARLDGYVEADGKTALDNSVILYTNELSDGKGHSFMDLPYILAGSAGGYFKQNQYIRLGAENPRNDDEKAPHNRLLNTLVNALGVESDWFGVPEGEGGETMQGGVYEELLA